MFLNDTPITPQSELYGQKCYMQVLMGEAREMKRTKYEVAGWWQDTAKAFNEVHSANVGFYNRWLRHVVIPNDQHQHWSYHGKPVKYISPMFIDLAERDLEIPRGCRIRLEFTLQSDDYYLMAQKGVKCKFELSDFFLLIPTATLNEGVGLKFEDRLAKQNYKMNFRRTTCVPFSVPQSTLYHTTDSLSIGEAPIRIAVTILRTSAVIGNKVKSKDNTHMSLFALPSC